MRSFDRSWVKLAVITDPRQAIDPTTIHVTLFLKAVENLGKVAQGGTI